ncbi:MAG: hypothetical protein KF858_10130 [Candidatus Sumerlaeia bacterium]|nr:hypothetical protein [Candidatus Sumerlaeia bacterium]
MNRRLPIAALLASAALVAVVATAQGPRPSTARSSFDEYRLITERNIFNPNRRAPSARPSGPTRTPAPVVRNILLTGTLVSGNGPVAFFHDDGREHSGARRERDAVVGWTIESITTKGVVVFDGTRRQEWAVGTPMRRIADGNWYLPESRSSSILDDPAAEAAILQRLRERRAQESSP